MNKVPLSPSPAPASPSAGRLAVPIGALLFAVVLLVDLLWLERIPWTPTLDDGAYAAAGYTLVRTGRAGLPLLPGLYGLDRDMVMYGRLPAMVVGFSQALLGVNAFADRLPSLLVILAATGVLIRLALFCGLSRRLALTAGLVWFVSVPARVLGHSARPDTCFMLLTLLVVWLLLRGLPSGRVWGAGLLAGVSLEIHMMGSALILALAAAVWLLSAPGRRWRNALLFSVAALPGALVWLWIHVLSQRELWVQQWGGLWSHWAPAPLLGGPGEILAAVQRRYAEWYWKASYHRYLFEVPFLIGAVAVGLRRRTPERALAVIFLLFHGMLALLAAGSHAGYMFAVYPLAVVLIVSACFGSSRRLLPACGAAFVIFSLSQTAYWTFRADRPLPSSAARDILRHVQGHAFLGADNLWFVVGPQAPLRSLVAATMLRVSTPESQWEAAFSRYLRAQKIEYIVEDQVFRDYLTPPSGEFLARHSEPVAQYDYGTGRLLRIRRLVLPDL